VELTRRSVLVYGLLLAVWVLVAGWQVEEHERFKSAARTDLRNRSKDIANTVSALIRGLRFRREGAVFFERLEPVLNELVNGRSNEIVQSSELLSIALLNAAGEPIAWAGKLPDLNQKDLQEGERWGQRTVTLVNPVDLGAIVTSEGVTNPAFVLPRFSEMTNVLREGRGPPRREGRPDEPAATNATTEVTNTAASVSNTVATEDGTNSKGSTERDARRRDGDSRPRRPGFFRNMSEAEYQTLMEKRALHGLLLTLSTDTFQVICGRDFWLRTIIILLATVLVGGSGMVWHNLSKLSDLQIRLLRASELNTHLKEMNLAAAGLAHETRNPLNIIRGLAQMISKQEDAQPEIRQRSRDILAETDKVTAQLTEFINYSRPREVRRIPVAMTSVVSEVVRALKYDVDEKKLSMEIKGDALTIEADEQLLRQALFNLILNAIQAVDAGGSIQIIVERTNAAEASIEVRDNGPGVSPGHRAEIFKPYFTTQKTGTGLGLAVVQQIVLAHGWEIECVTNEPRGAVFRIRHLKIAG
jgi:signal transduction histidine kinase